MDYKGFWKKYFVVAAYFGGSAFVFGQGDDDVLDPCENPLTDVMGAYLVPSEISGQSEVEILFADEVSFDQNCLVHSFGALNLPIDPGANFSTAMLEDLNGDGHLDLIVPRSSDILLFPNSAESELGELNFGNPTGERFPHGYSVLAQRKHWAFGQNTDPPENATAFVEPRADLGTSVCFGDIDGDRLVDLICSSSNHGHVSFFKGTGVDALGFPQFLPEQEILRVGASGEERFINHNQIPGLSQPSPLILDFNGDSIMDLLLATSRPQQQKDIRVFLGTSRRVSGYHKTPTGGSLVEVPVFEESTPLTVGDSNSPVILQEPYDGASTISLIDINQDTYLDLVVSTEGGRIFYYQGRGRDGSENLAFDDQRSLLDLNDSPLSLGVGSMPKACDVNQDGKVDFVSSSDAFIGPSRKEIRIHMANNMGAVDSRGYVLGTRGQNLPLTLETRARWTSGDVSGDGKRDCIFIRGDGRIAVSYSTDTGNNFDPKYSTHSFLRKVAPDGEISELRLDDIAEHFFEEYSLGYSGSSFTQPSVVDLDNDSIGDVLVLGQVNALIAFPLRGVDGEGCLTVALSESYPILLKDNLDLDGDHWFSADFADFDSTDAVSQPDGMVITFERLSNPYYNSLRYFRIHLHEGRITPDLSTEIEIASNEIDPTDEDAVNRMNRFPRLADLDSDNILDIIVTDVPHIVWYQGDVLGSNPSFKAPQALKVEGAEPKSPLVDWISRDTQLVPITSSLTSQRYLLMGGLIGSSKIFRSSDESLGSGSFKLTPDSTEARINQVLAARVEQLGPRRVRAAFPVHLQEGGAIALNLLFVGESQASFCEIPVLKAANDSDFDGLDDEWEIANGFDPEDIDENGNGIFDGVDDFDNDSISNFDEMRAMSDPLVPASENPTEQIDEISRSSRLFHLPFSDQFQLSDGSPATLETVAEFPAILSESEILDDFIGPFEGIPESVLSLTAPSSLLRLEFFDEKPTQSMTLSLWFQTQEKNRSQFLVSAQSRFNPFYLSIIDQSTFGNPLSQITVKMGYLNRHGNPINFVINQEISDGQWHHLALVQDLSLFDGGDSKLRILLDGLVVGQYRGPLHPYLSGFASPERPGVLVFGQHVVSNSSGSELVPDRNFTGLMDDIRMFKTALSDQQVRALGVIGNPAEDTDSDFLPDNWEIEHFGTLIYAAEDNPDGDYDDGSPTTRGVDPYTNLEEYYRGTDPNSFFNGVENFQITIEAPNPPFVYQGVPYAGPFRVVLNADGPINRGAPGVIRLGDSSHSEASWSPTRSGTPNFTMGDFKTDSEGVQFYTFFLSSPIQ